MSKWIKVCLAEDVPKNKIKKFSVGDFDIVLANYGDGLRAFPPVCPHMREPLDVSGFIDNDVLTCGKHIWQWDLRACTKASTMTEENLLFYELKEIVIHRAKKTKYNLTSIEFIEFNSNIEKMTLKAFDCYCSHREKIYQLKVDESKNKAYMLIKKAGL